MKIPIARTNFTQDEFDIIQKPLKSGWVVQGPYTRDFEKKWCEFTGANYSIAVTSCTTALHLSLVALGLKKDDEVILPAFTWISTANVVEHINAKVVFCDIDLKTFNIDTTKIEKLINENTKAIIPVHLFGLSADMQPINSIAKKYNLWVVEDAACGFGSKYQGKHVGTLGDTGCFSFHPRKAITTGEGGMITTNNEQLADKMRSLRDHGAEVSDFQRHYGSKPYLLSEFPYAGFNYRMTDIQAAIGSSQMNRAEKIISERRQLANKYYNELSKKKLFHLPNDQNNYLHSFQSYACLFDSEYIDIQDIGKIRMKRNLFMDFLEKKGVSTRPATHAVHMLKYYKNKYKLSSEDYPNAYIANECSISFPLFNGMSKEEFQYIIVQIKKYF